MKNDNLTSEFNNTLPVDDSNLSFDYVLNSVGFKHLLPPDSQSDEQRNSLLNHQYKKGKTSGEYKLIYIIQGNGHINFEGEKEEVLSEGNIVIIFPNQKYRYYYNNDIEWKEYFIRFEAFNNGDLLLKKFFNRNNQIIEIGHYEEIIKLFRTSTELVKDGLVASQLYLSGMLIHILGFLIFVSKNKAVVKREMKQIEFAKAIMNENVMIPVSLQHIASKLNISYTAFRAKFKQYAGVSPAKYYTDIRIEKAKQLLGRSSQSVKEIAYSMNFSSIEHFTRLFKKLTGITPKEFRKTNSQGS